MRKENLIAAILLLCSLFTNGQEWVLPPQDADSLSITNVEIEIDKTTQSVNIKKSTYDRLSVFHRHYNYQTTINEIDTILLTSSKDNAQLDLRFNEFSRV